MERILGAMLTVHLDYEEYESARPSQSNRRNGTSGKVLKGQDGELPVSIPRDHDSSYEPKLVRRARTGSRVWMTRSSGATPPAG